MKSQVFAILLAVSALCLSAADIPLPAANEFSDVSLKKALALRKSGREYAGKELPLPMLSALLWSADGINRADGKRTAPTGLNVQDIDIYVILSSGVYLYDAKENLLKEIQQGDFREAAGKQPFVQTAPVNLVYVQNLDKAMKGDETTKARHGGIHTGAIMQNVYLFCAANGLACVARDYVDRPVLIRTLRLKESQRIMLAHTVGFPADAKDQR